MARPGQVAVLARLACHGQPAVRRVRLAQVPAAPASRAERLRLGWSQLRGRCLGWSQLGRLRLGWSQLRRLCLGWSWPGRLRLGWSQLGGSASDGPGPAGSASDGPSSGGAASDGPGPGGPGGPGSGGPSSNSLAPNSLNLNRADPSGPEPDGPDSDGRDSDGPDLDTASNRPGPIGDGWRYASPSLPCLHSLSAGPSAVRSQAQARRTPSSFPHGSAAQRRIYFWHREAAEMSATAPACAVGAGMPGSTSWVNRAGPDHEGHEALGRPAETRPSPSQPERTSSGGSGRPPPVVRLPWPA